jgi:hypothetical protein
MYSANELYQKYEDEITKIFSLIKTDREAAIPRILAEITTIIVPEMMHDVGNLKSLSGAEKRQLIIGSIELSIKETFKQLNRFPDLAIATWDETLRNYLLVLIPPTIKILVDVEKKNITFNRKISGCFGCCGWRQ